MNETVSQSTTCLESEYVSTLVVSAINAHSKCSFDLSLVDFSQNKAAISRIREEVACLLLNHKDIAKDVIEITVARNRVTSLAGELTVNQSLVSTPDFMKSVVEAYIPMKKGDPAVPIADSIQPDYLVCLEDGKKLKLLKRHLAKCYKMTPDQYRARWGLPPDYPMVSQNYSAVRSKLAQQNGLGRKNDKS